MEWNTGDPANMYQLLISEHAGTHLDCPAHFYGDQADARHVSLDNVPVEHIIGRAVVLDFRGCPADHELNAGDIQGWEVANQPLRENEDVIFRFGWEHK
jgi:kynurenine formamidase